MMIKDTKKQEKFIEFLETKNWFLIIFFLWQDYNFCNFANYMFFSESLEHPFKDSTILRQSKGY